MTKTAKNLDSNVMKTLLKNHYNACVDQLNQHFLEEAEGNMEKAQYLAQRAIKFAYKNQDNYEFGTGDALFDLCMTILNTISVLGDYE